jgi:hypothetical protein
VLQLFYYPENKLPWSPTDNTPPTSNGPILAKPRPSRANLNRKSQTNPQFPTSSCIQTPSQTSPRALPNSTRPSKPRSAQPANPRSALYSYLSLALARARESCNPKSSLYMTRLHKKSAPSKYFSACPSGWIQTGIECMSKAR